MSPRFLFAILITFVIAASPTIGQETGDRPLKPGPFPYLPDVALGDRIDFENEIDTTRCYPLLVSGEVVGWIARAYGFDKKLLVQRCIEFDPRIEQTKGNRHGGLNGWLEEARLSTRRDALLLTRLQLPNWSQFSNATFCATLVSYWGFRGQELVPTIYNLRTGLASASRSLGIITLETDNTGFLPPPKWAAGCLAATFDGLPIERPIVTLSIRTRP